MRRLIIAVVALLLAAQVIRAAAVDALAPLQPAVAARFWPGDPSVEISRALAVIGQAARERRAIGQKTFEAMDDAAAKAPLSPEPFLVRGVEAQTAGDEQVATRAFLAAQWRDPRSVPAAYFLAGHYLRSGDALHGLQQTATLARLTPQAGGAVAPFIAAYAEDRANWAQMRALFRSEQEMEGDVLALLAQDARNTDAILAVADANHRTPESAWLRVLLGSLLNNGDYSRARAIWSSIGRANAGASLLYDGDFQAPAAPPPFNWQFASATVGLAERQPGKQLHVIFFGNEDGVLASELVLLPAGRYRLQMKLAGSSMHPEALQWSLRCDKSSEPIASVGIAEVALHGWDFAVPANCPAQWLELIGRSGDFPQQSDVTITSVKIERGGANA